LRTPVPAALRALRRSCFTRLPCLPVTKRMCQREFEIIAFAGAVTRRSGPGQVQCS
jgi:hypothetical protein